VRGTDRERGRISKDTCPRRLANPLARGSPRCPSRPSVGIIGPARDIRRLPDAVTGCVILALPQSPSRAPYSPDALRALVVRVARGDEAALESLYRMTVRRVLGMTFRVLGDRESAEEAALDVYAQAWRQAERFDPVRGSVMTWLLTLARTRAIDLRRTRARQRRGEVECMMPVGDQPGEVQPIEMEDTQPSPFDLTELTERAEQVRQAMESLPPAQRTAIEVAFFQGLSHTEAAAHLGEPLGTIKTRIRAGLITLKRLLGCVEETTS
jgi:RNA polymerase sigma-70 factor (ECF subfamily)